MPSPLKLGSLARGHPGRGAATNSQRFVTNRCDFQTWVQMAPGGVQQAWTDILGMRLLGTLNLGLKNDFRLNRVYIVWVEVPMAGFELR